MRFVRFYPGKVAKWLTIYYCQNISAIKEKVKELQDRVCHLMMVIVVYFTPKNEELEGTGGIIVKAAKSIERDSDIMGLLMYVQAS